MSLDIRSHQPTLAREVFHPLQAILEPDNLRDQELALAWRRPLHPRDLCYPDLSLAPVYSVEEYRRLEEQGYCPDLELLAKQ